MKEGNVRFGVVNVADRAKYEKTFHTPFGYEFTTFNEHEAIAHCRQQKNPNTIVERIFDTSTASNNKEEIFRGGVSKEGGK